MRIYSSSIYSCNYALTVQLAPGSSRRACMQAKRGAVCLLYTRYIKQRQDYHITSNYTCYKGRNYSPGVTGLRTRAGLGCVSVTLPSEV